MRSIYRAQCDCNQDDKVLPGVVYHSDDQEELGGNEPVDIEFFIKCRICGTRYSEEPVEEELDPNDPRLMFSEKEREELHRRFHEAEPLEQRNKKEE